MEFQTVLDHIWQCYINENSSAIHLCAQVYYTTFLNAIQSFYDLEEYPINIAGIFMAHINPIYAKGFCANYSTHSQARERLAITQHRILINMLQALIKAEAVVTNILEIVRVNQRSGEQFYQAPPGTAPAFPSLAERMINSFSNGDMATKSTARSAGLECSGCGGPHPWSKRKHGKWTVLCPNATKPSIQERAALHISQLQTRKKKQAREYKKKKKHQHYQPGRPACQESGVYPSPAAIGFIGGHSRQPEC
jgi:hypothetical protein